MTVLRQAKAAIEKGGYEVQTIRITTQPFTEYIGERSTTEALAFFESLDELSKKDSFMLNIGPLTLSNSSDTAKIELLSQILANTRAMRALWWRVKTECIGTRFERLHR